MNDHSATPKLATSPTGGRVRHQSVTDLLAWFNSDHLAPDLQEIVTPIREAALQLADALPDDPELTTGLRKLLEGKDCFVRAAVRARGLVTTGAGS